MGRSQLLPRLGLHPPGLRAELALPAALGEKEPLRQHSSLVFAEALHNALPARSSYSSGFRRIFTPVRHRVSEGFLPWLHIVFQKNFYPRLGPLSTASLAILN